MYKKSRQSWLKHVDFLLIDLILVAVVYYGCIIFRSNYSELQMKHMMIRQLGPMLILVYLSISILGSSYKNILRRSAVQEIKSVLLQCFGSYSILSMYLYATQNSFLFSRIVYFTAAILTPVVVLGARIIWKWILRSYFINNNKQPRVLIIADSVRLDSCVRNIRRRRYIDFFVSGVVVTDAKRKGEQIADYPIVCNPEELKEYLLSEVVDEVLIATNSSEVLKDLSSYCIEAGITVHISLNVAVDDLPNQMIEKMGGQPVLTGSNHMAPGWQLFLKRVMDICGGLVGLLFTGILIVIIGPIIYKKDPGPIFFSQTRVGKNGRQFKIYKFRSMYQDAEKRKAELMSQNQMNGLMFKMENDPRILPGIGNFIRDWSLDEFPQFWNVLKGDMSLVGTRPPTLDEFKQYAPHHKMRLSFNPGLTGMWQVSGRSNIKDFEEIVALDNKYIVQWSIWLDILILFKTVKVVLGNDGSM